MKIPTPLLLAVTLGAGNLIGAGLPYPVVSTGQHICFDNSSRIAPPGPGQPFHGQDAQVPSKPASYQISNDGLMVRDRITGLDWQRSPDTDRDGKITARDKLTPQQAAAQVEKLNRLRFGGFDDWRLPSIKELYSLFDARGIDPSGPMDMDPSQLTAFIDTKVFEFAYGDTSAGERVIDSQYLSSTKFVGKSPRPDAGEKQFGVNFADGRIKGYDLNLPRHGGRKTFFVMLVRGNPAYGINKFHDNGEGTVTDRATGLTWSRHDSGQGMDWQAALKWVEQKDAEKYLGYDDWRLPDIKELQSIVDYGRSPDTSHSAAIDPVFNSSEILNEGGEKDYPFYWSSTTHIGMRGGDAAMYVAFGRAAAFLSHGRRPGGGDGKLPCVDIHGAGAQRSDPKSGDASRFPQGRGPQSDVIRIRNYVRPVRSSTLSSS